MIRTKMIRTRELDAVRKYEGRRPMGRSFNAVGGKRSELAIVNGKSS